MPYASKYTIARTIIGCKEVISIAWSVNERSEAKCCSEKERVKKKAKHKTLVGD